jgi:Transposase DDE domain
VTCLQPGTLNCADRNFFSMHRWRTAAATGAHLVWRVKNGAGSLPARVVDTLPDGSRRVRLRESDGMLSRRRKTTGDKKAPRLEDITARLVEFTVTVTDEAGRTRPSRFRVLTTLLDHQAYPAQEIAACYAERWQVELTYKTIKTTLRGGNRRLRGQAPDLAEQELWGLLAVYNTLVDQAVATAVDLGIDPDEISFTVVLRATRDHLTTHAPCPGCGRHGADPAALTTAIAAGPRNRTDRTRAAPRTQKQRQTEHTRNVSYTITITESNLPRAA